MNLYIVCISAALSADPSLELTQPIYQPAETIFSSAGMEGFTIRGQGPQEPAYYEEPAQPQSFNPPAMMSPFSRPAVGDPFIGGPGQPSPYTPGPAVQFAFGANGPQPYRYGVTSRVEMGIMPKERTDTGIGNMGVLETDIDFEYTAPTGLGWIFSVTQEYGLRNYDGPSGDVGLAGSVHRFGGDFELATPADNGPWSMQLAFNPSLNTDFAHSPNRDAYNWDGRAIAFYRHSPHFLLALGAGYLDRVNDQVIPYAGVVLTPNDRWEWRILFPESRVSYFLGNFGGVSQWMYLRGEYHIEAYQVELGPDAARYRDKIQLEDWRLLLGVRGAGGWVTGFAEAGIVMGRKVKFGGPTSNFGVSTGFIGRAGMRF